MRATATIRGEHVEVLGPKPQHWMGLGSTVEGATLLVRYPDGEEGAVRPSDLQNIVEVE